MTRSNTMVLFRNYNSQPFACFYVSVVYIPMDLTKLKVSCVRVYETRVLTGTLLASCLDSHTLRHFG